MANCKTNLTSSISFEGISCCFSLFYYLSNINICVLKKNHEIIFSVRYLFPITYIIQKKKLSLYKKNIHNIRTYRFDILLSWHKHDILNSVIVQFYCTKTIKCVLSTAWTLWYRVIFYLRPSTTHSQFTHVFTNNAKTASTSISNFYAVILNIIIII